MHSTHDGYIRSTFIGLMPQGLYSFRKASVSRRKHCHVIRCLYSDRASSHTYRNGGKDLKKETIKKLPRNYLFKSFPHLPSFNMMSEGYDWLEVRGISFGFFIPKGVPFSYAEKYLLWLQPGMKGECIDTFMQFLDETDFKMYCNVMEWNHIPSEHCIG